MLKSQVNAEENLTLKPEEAKRHTWLKSSPRWQIFL